MNSTKTKFFVIGGFFIVFILGLSWVSSIPEKNNPVPPQVKMPAEEKAKLLSMAISKNGTKPATIPAKFANPASHDKKQSKISVTAQAPAKSIATGRQILNRINNIKNITRNNPKSPKIGLSRGIGSQVTNPKQQKAIDKLLDKLGGNATLQMDNVSRTLRYLDGDLSKIVNDSQSYQDADSQKNYSGMSIALVDELGLVMNLNEPKKEFVTDRIKEDNLGMTHVFLQQEYKGIPVYGAQVGVHYDKNSNPIQVSGVYAPMPGMISDVKSWINQETALQNARQDTGSTDADYASPKIEQMIYWDIDKVPVQTYFVALTPTIYDHWHVFVSAETGKIVHKSRPICSAAAVGQSTDLSGQVRDVHCWEDGGTFGAIDTTRPMYETSSQPPDIKATKGAIIVLDAENQILEEAQSFTIVNSNNKNNWDPTAVSVLHNYSLVEDYYRRTFNRNSIDDKGMNILAIIHAQFKGSDGSVYKDNAFWNPGAQLMVFGDGEVDFENLPSSLDVTGHELTHGVIDHEAKLIYENQSGALNEHLADFFGAMIDRDEWLLGDGVTRGKEALRDMKNPHNPNILAMQPQTMTEYKNLPNTPQGDYGGVHVNSGIPNHMSYLLAEGADGIGRDKTEKILYRALSEYMTQRSSFIDYRRAAISSTRDLHGENSAEEAVVKKAFDAVEIFDQDGGDATDTNTPTPGQATIGADVALFLLGDPNAGIDPVHDDLYYQLAINTNGENLLAAPRYVINTRPAVSGDGKWFLYVDAENNIYWTDGASEEKWTDSGIIRSIAMSKDQRYIVFTTTSYDNFITVIDTVSGEVNIADLYVTRMDGVTQDLNFADVMTFNFRGDSLIYDAVMQMQLDDGEKYPVWGIYCLRMVDLNTQQLIAQTPGEQIGNPTIANTNDHLLLADYVVSEGEDQALAMVAIDFLDMQMSVLFGPMNDFAHPTFRGDDQKIIFRGSTDDNTEFGLLEAELKENELSLIDASTNVLFEANAPITYPVGFRIGEYVKQEGKISVPQSIVIGETPVLTQNSQTISIANIGNSDLSLIEISIEEDIDGAFSHTGINQQISAGKNIPFDIVFNPQKTGAASASLKIKSTDASQPEVIISISGNGTAANTPTPTLPAGVNTPTPAAPTPTPINGLEPTPLPGSEDQLTVYEFDQNLLSANGWMEIPGGFGGATPGLIDLMSFDAGLFSSSADNKGLSIAVEPEQISFIMANASIDTENNPILMRMTVRSNNANASVFLVALKGELSTNTLDGSLAYNNRVNASSFLDKDQRLTLIYEPDQGGKITPAIQIVGTGDETTTVYVDKLEIFMLKPDGSYSGKLFRSTQ
jgi:bacillolysin